MSHFLGAKIQQYVLLVSLSISSANEFSIWKAEGPPLANNLKALANAWPRLRVLNVAVFFVVQLASLVFAVTERDFVNFNCLLSH